MEGISVLIVTYNRADLIGETLACVLNQTFQNLEIIIIDDGSTDKTEEVVNSFNNSKINYFKYPRIGRLTKLRNIAVSKSNNEFIAFIDSDDLWHAEKLEKCINACKTHNSAICLTDCIEFKGSSFSKQSRGNSLNKLTNVDIKREILINNIPLTYGSNIFLNKKVYTKINGFDESLFHGDHDFLCRALYDAPGLYLPLVYSFIRKHDSNMSLNENNKDLSSLLEYNLTLRKLLDKALISTEDFKKVSATNHFLMASHAASNADLRISFSHLFSALLIRPSARGIASYLKSLLSLATNKTSANR